MAYKASYSRNTPKPRVLRENRKPVTISNAPPVSSRAPVTVSVPSQPKPAQPPRISVSTLPIKSSGGDVAIQPAKSGASERRSAKPAMAAPAVTKKTQQASIALKAFPKRTQAQVAPKFTPLTVTKVPKGFTLDHRPLPHTKEQLHYKQAVDEREAVNRYLLVEAAREASGLNPNYPFIKRLSDDYNTSMQSPTYTYEEIRKRVENPLYQDRDASPFHTMFNYLGRILPEESLIRDDVSVTKFLKDKAIAAGRGIANLGFIAGIPALVAGLQVEKAPSSPEELGKQQLKSAINGGFDKIWELNVPPSIRGAINIGTATDIVNRDLYTSDAYFDQLKYLDNIKSALNRTLSKTYALFGVKGGKEPDMADRTLEAYKWKYFGDSAVPTHEKAQAIRYAAGREFIDNFIDFVPRRIGAATINIPLLRTALYDLAATGVSPRAKQLVESLRDIGRNVPRISPVFEAERPPMEFAPLELKNETGISDIAVRREGNNLALGKGIIPMLKIDPEVLELARTNTEAASTIEKTKKQSDEFEAVSRELANAERKLKDLNQKIKTKTAEWTDYDTRYQAAKRANLVDPHDSERMNTLITELNDLKTARDRQQAIVDSLTNERKEKGSAAFKAVLELNKYRAKVDDPAIQEKAEEASQFVTAENQALIKKFDDEIQKLKLEVSLEKGRLDNPANYMLGTVGWPVDAKNQLTGDLNNGKISDEERQDFLTKKFAVANMAQHASVRDEIVKDLQTWALMNGVKLPSLEPITDQEPSKKLSPDKTTGDGTIDYAKQALNLMKEINAIGIKKGAGEAVSNYFDWHGHGEPPRQKYFRALTELVQAYDERVAKYGDDPGAPSINQEQKAKIEQSYNALMGKLQEKTTERDRLQGLLVKKNVEPAPVRKLNQQQKFYEMRVLNSNAPLESQQVAFNPPKKANASSQALVAEPPASNAVKAPESSTLDTLMATYSAALALGLLGSEILGKALNKNTSLDLGYAVNNPNYIEMSPSKNENPLQANPFTEEAKETMSNTELRNIVQNYFIGLNSPAKKENERPDQQGLKRPLLSDSVQVEEEEIPKRPPINNIAPIDLPRHEPKESMPEASILSGLRSLFASLPSFFGFGSNNNANPNSNYRAIGMEMANDPNPPEDTERIIAQRNAQRNIREALRKKK